MPLLESVPTTQRAAGLDPTARGGSVALPSGHLSIADAQRLLENVGFLLVPGLPLEYARAYLLVALRPRPTLAHYDPERVEYWTVDRNRPERVELDRFSVRPNDLYSWGTVRILDRVGAVNSFVSFGGMLLVGHDNHLRVALFSSDAPIVALCEHSGPADPLGASVDGFFACLRAAAGCDEQVRRDAATLSPVALYAAYIHERLARMRAWVEHDAGEPSVALMRSERDRLRASSPTDEALGRQLARRLRRDSWRSM